MQVKDGEIVERIEIALFGAVLAGRIVNELAEPMAGVRVEAMELAYSRGHRLPLPAGFVFSNDLGEFRLSELNPGRYYIRASTMERWPDEDERKWSFAYAQTFYPGVAGADRAEMINLTAGQHLESLDFPLVVGRAVHVTVRLTSSTGEPMANQRVGLSRIDRTTGGALFSSSAGGAAQTDSNGAFDISEIPPGESSLSWESQQTETVTLPLMVTDVRPSIPAPDRGAPESTRRRCARSPRRPPVPGRSA